MDRAQHVHQDHLPVDPGEMRAEEGADHVALVALVAALEFAPEGAAAGSVGLRQGREGQHRGACEIAGQQEPARRAVGPARGPGLREIGGVAPRQGLGHDLVEIGGTVGGPGVAEPVRPATRRDPAQGVGGPGGVVLLQQRKIQQPFAGIVDDVEMHRPRAGQARQQARRLHPERQAQFGDVARALGPGGLWRGQARNVLLVVEARDRVVGLGLQIGGADRAARGGAELRHPAPVHQVRHQRGDEHRLARPAETRHAEADHRVGEGRGREACGAFHPAGDAVRDRRDDQVPAPYLSRPEHRDGPRRCNPRQPRDLAADMR